MVWIARTGAPWRDLPEQYGAVGTVSRHFSRWRTAGRGDRIVAALQQYAAAEGQLDWDLHVVAGTTVRAHQHAAGAKGGTQKAKRWAAAEVAAQPPAIVVPKVGATR